jgi:predicted AlkP superfamily pyrophosphatase or phosphodiesterase
MPGSKSYIYRNCLGAKLFWIPLLALSVLVLLQGLTSDRRNEYKNYVVMVSLDAWRWDYNKLYNTPIINKLGEEGIKAERLIPSFPTNTFPNHYSIATGLYPDHHGLINNTFPAPDLGLLYRIGDRAAIENPAFYGGEPVWVTAMKQGIITASFFWVGSEAPIAGMHPDYWKAYSDSYTYEERIDTVIKWLSYPIEKRPGLVTLYFDEPDATSHDSGPVSNETGRVVQRLDSLIGVLRERLSSLPYTKRINLIVLSDHGMAQLSPEKYVNIRNVVPNRMIAGIFGSNPVYLINASQGKKDSVLMLLNRTPGIKAYKKEELPKRLNYGTHPRIPEIVVIGDSSWSVGTRADASSYTGGTHGYDIANSDMNAIFYATGPAFKKGRTIESMDNTDIYNIVCRILDIKPAQNDGDPGIVKKLLR